MHANSRTFYLYRMQNSWKRLDNMVDSTELDPVILVCNGAEILVHWGGVIVYH